MCIVVYRIILCVSASQQKEKKRGRRRSDVDEEEEREEREEIEEVKERSGGGAAMGAHCRTEKSNRIFDFRNSGSFSSIASK